MHYGDNIKKQMQKREQVRLNKVLMQCLNAILAH